MYEALSQVARDFLALPPCRAAVQGDLVVIGSDGVFDNLFKDEAGLGIASVLVWMRVIGDRQGSPVASKVAAIINQLVPRPSTPGEKPPTQG